MARRNKSIMTLPNRMKFGIFLAPFLWLGDNPTLALERDLESIHGNISHKMEPFNFVNLKLENISYSYSYLSNEKENKIISNFHLELKAGEVLGVIGRTGSGKSTLLDLISGLIKPTEGYISINGIDINSPKNISYLNHWQRSISVVPQSLYLIDSTIKSNIAFAIKSSTIDYDSLIVIFISKIFY